MKLQKLLKENIGNDLIDVIRYIDKIKNNKNYSDAKKNESLEKIIKYCEQSKK
jgi:hypothetical protein